MTLARLTCSALLVVVAGSGCAKADTAPTTAPGDPSSADATPGTSQPDGEPAAGHGKHQHDHDFEGAVVSFHDTMAPLWHAAAGEARLADTCAAADALIEHAQAVKSEPAPAEVTDGDAWTAASADLVAGAQFLKITCADTPADFDAAFTALHEAFHALVKLRGDGTQ